MNQKGVVPLIVFIVIGAILLGGVGGAWIVWWMNSPKASIIMFVVGSIFGLIMVPNACRIVSWAKKVWREVKA